MKSIFKATLAVAIFATSFAHGMDTFSSWF